MHLKAIFFDNDGVLVDSEKFYYEANRIVYAENGIELTVELYTEFFLRQNIGAWHLLEAKGYSKEQVSELQKKRSGIYADFLRDEDLLIPGARELVEELRGKLSLGIVSSSKKEHFDIIHQNTGIPEMMDFVLTRPDYKNSKPSPDPYLRALELAGCRVEEALVIEDSFRGLQAAKAAGLDCVILRSELLDGARFEGAKEILDSPAELREYLQQFPNLKE